MPVWVDGGVDEWMDVQTDRLVGWLVDLLIGFVKFTVWQQFQ